MPVLRRYSVGVAKTSAFRGVERRMRHAPVRMGALAIVLATIAAGCTSTDVGAPGQGASSARRTAATSGSPSSRPQRSDTGEATQSDASTGTSTSASTDGSTGTTQATSTEPTGTGRPTTSSRPVAFRAAAALRTIRVLAGGIGPREASSADFRSAARWVQQRFERLGYEVHRQPLRVPAGTSWGIPVPAGRTWNIVATLGRPHPAQPQLVVGAHLDTVPQAPGAEDNASGVAVLLELARLAMLKATRLPVTFVAFTGEEPRGAGDALHHFGSTAMAERMTPAQRDAVAGMVAMDRVGVGTTVPVCTGGRGPTAVQAALVRAAHETGVPASACLNTLSDHWSFEKVGIAAARVGGTPFAAYHSAADVPSVVNPRQLARTGRLMWSWLKR